MKDASYSIMSGYMRALLGIEYDGLLVPAYPNAIPYNDNSKRYIVAASQSLSETSLKCGFAGDYIISLNIVTKQALGSANPLHVETISNEVLSRVYPETGETGIIISDDFHIWKTRLISGRTMDDTTTDERIITKILTFQHSVNEIS